MAEVRGYSAYDGRARVLPRVLAAGIDLTLLVSVPLIAWSVAEASGRFAGSPVLHLIVIAVMTTAAWLAGAWISGSTAGQAIWGLRRLVEEAKKRKPRTVVEWIEARTWQHEKLTPGRSFTAIGLTVFLFGLSAVLLATSVSHYPLLQPIATVELQPYAPEPPNDPEQPQTRWAVTPFFYSIGAWPTIFVGHPVFYSLPYAKGPPSHFVGSMIARWKMPEIEVRIEGPRTPIRTEKNRSFPESRDRTQRCLASIWPFRSPLGCLFARDLALSRHLRDLQEHFAADSGTTWDIHWFIVKNPAIPVDEQPQGIYVSLSTENRTEERYVLVNPRGAHQTFILVRPNNEEGALASAALQQAIRSQRVSDELNTGRAWADRQLAATRIEDIQKAAKPEEFGERISEFQRVLMAKISVDPQSFDAYFHLAGTASLLARGGLKHHDTNWSAIAKPLVQSAYRFAQDINPQEPRVAQIHRMWMDVK